MHFPDSEDDPTTRFIRSGELLTRASRVVPGGVHSGRRHTDPPFCIQTASGAYVVDSGNYTYIDYQAGAGAVILGHDHPAVSEAVRIATKRGVLYGIGTSELEVALAERIVHHVPSVEKVLFANSGSEAALGAIRLARAVTGRELVVKFQGCYHGHPDYVLCNCQSAADKIGRSDPHSAGMLAAAVDATIACRYNSIVNVEEAFAEFPDSIAAIIVEPIAHNGPGIMPRDGFLEGLRELCDTHGALLVFDEVITGFRHSLGGYQGISGVLPDLTMMGKAIANGYQLSALGGLAQYMDRFNTNPGGDVVWAGTYNGQQASVAAALATIEVMETEPVHEHIFRLGEHMRVGLREIVARLGIPATVCGYGSLFCLWFTPRELWNYDDVVKGDVDLFRRYRRELLSRNVLEFPDADGARSHIGYAHSLDDIERTLMVNEAALRAVTTGPGHHAAAI